MSLIYNYYSFVASSFPQMCHHKEWLGKKIGKPCKSKINWLEKLLQFFSVPSMKSAHKYIEKWPLS